MFHQEDRYRKGEDLDLKGMALRKTALEAFMNRHWLKGVYNKILVHRPTSD